MNLGHIYRRIEITFWNIVVGALTDRRILNKVGAALAVLVIFVLVTSLVFAAGQLALQWAQAKAADMSLDNAIVIPAGGNPRQTNLLLVMVSDMGAAQPHLDGLWVLVYQRSNEHIIFLPLSVTDTPTGANPLLKLEDSLYIKSDGQLSQDFIEAVRIQNIRMDGYVLVDRVALGALLDWLPQTQADNPLAAFVQPGQDWKSGELGQSQLLQHLCEGADVWSIFLKQPGNWEKLETHFRLSIAGQQAALLDLLPSSVNWSCEMPVFQDGYYAP